MKRIFGMTTMGLTAGMVSSGELALPAWVGDHMVIQAGQPWVIMGSAPPGTAVVAEFAGRTGRASTDDDGAWRLELGPFQAGVAGDLRLAGGDAERTVREVVVGDVWLCAGQSNMGLPVGHCRDADGMRNDADGECDVRMLTANGWQRLATAAAIGSVSAVAWSFAHARAQMTGIPIGVAVTARGGTRIESWVPRRALASLEHGRNLLALAESPEVQAAAEEDRKTFKPYDQTALSRWNLGRALPVELYEALIRPLAGVPLSGVVWYQGESNAANAADAAQYADLLEALIAGYRAAWNAPALPFVVIQLPRYEPDAQTAHHWDILRRSQQAAVQRASPAVLVDILDLGEPRDIHPRDKREVGRRAAQAAQFLFTPKSLSTESRG